MEDERVSSGNFGSVGNDPVSVSYLRMLCNTPCCMVENALAMGARGFGIVFVGVGFEVDIIHGILHQQIDLPGPSFRKQNR
jgi:hypothetical protein